MCPSGTRLSYSSVMDSVPFRHEAVHTGGYRSCRVAAGIACQLLNAARVNVLVDAKLFRVWVELHFGCGRAEVLPLAYYGYVRKTDYCFRALVPVSLALPADTARNLQCAFPALSCRLFLVVRCALPALSCTLCVLQLPFRHLLQKSMFRIYTYIQLPFRHMLYDHWPVG